jgi:hypothetical protein
MGFSWQTENFIVDSSSVCGGRISVPANALFLHCSIKRGTSPAVVVAKPTGPVVQGYLPPSTALQVYGSPLGGEHKL